MNELLNYNFCQDTLELKDTIEKSFLALGERLGKIRENELYRPQWTSFAEYCGELKMSESTASKLISIYQKFIIGFGIDPEKILGAGGWSVAAEVLPYSHDREGAEALLDEATVLSREDMRKKLKELKTGIPQDKCSHDDKFTLQVCRNCGDKQVIHEQETND